MVVVVDNECRVPVAVWGKRKVVMVAFTTDEIDDYNTYLCLFPFFLGVCVVRSCIYHHSLCRPLLSFSSILITSLAITHLYSSCCFILYYYCCIIITTTTNNIPLSLTTIIIIMLIVYSFSSSSSSFCLRFTPPNAGHSGYARTLPITNRTHIKRTRNKRAIQYKYVEAFAEMGRQTRRAQGFFIGRCC